MPPSFETSRLRQRRLDGEADTEVLLRVASECETLASRASDSRRRVGYQRAAATARGVASMPVEGNDHLGLIIALLPEDNEALEEQAAVRGLIDSIRRRGPTRNEVAYIVASLTVGFGLIAAYFASVPSEDRPAGLGRAFLLAGFGLVAVAMAVARRLRVALRRRTTR